MSSIGRSIDDTDGLVRILVVVALVGAAVAAALFAARSFFAVSFSAPLQITTSGSEEESLLAVWNVVKGNAVYLDRLNIPYTATVYNWLFYESYGTVAKFALRAFSLGDAWLPTVARLFTLAGCAALASASYIVVRAAFGVSGALGRLLAAAMAVTLAFGPLIGFWGLTVRSDVWGLALEATAASVFLAFYPSRPWRAIFWLAVLAYGAWAFKQTAVAGLCAAGGVLLLRCDVRRLGVLIVAMAALFAATFWIGGRQYTEDILFLGWPLVYDFGHWFDVAVNATAKSTVAVFGLIGAAAWMVSSWDRLRSAFSDDVTLFAALGVAATLLLHVTASGQSGSAENYYFSIHWFAMLFVAAVIGRAVAATGTIPRPLLAALGVGWVATAAVSGLVLAGIKGAIDLRAQHGHFMMLKACADALPRPVLATPPYLALPWMTPGSIPIVLSWNYIVDRRHGRTFEADGLAGMIAKRKFAAIMLGRISQTEEFEGLNGGLIPGYRRFAPTACGETPVYVRAEPDANNPEATMR